MALANHDHAIGLGVVRDGAGTIRAFHNVCRHRAGPLVDRGTGRCHTLVCRYHGWSYELDGHLKRARDFGDAALPVDELGLLPVSVAIPVITGAFGAVVSIVTSNAEEARLTLPAKSVAVAVKL